MSGGNQDDTNWGKWIGGIIATVLGGVILFALTREGGPINPAKPTTIPSTEPAPRGGDIIDAQMAIARPCCTFSVQVRIAGLRGQTNELRWSIVNSVGSLFPVPQGVSFIPDANVDQARADAVVSITNPGTYYVRFVLYDPNGVELDRLDTQTFNVR